MLGQTIETAETTTYAELASMEGRAIARPNLVEAGRGAMLAAGFNGGPSNCSAKPVRGAGAGPRHHGASMEGRAIARPNRLPRLCGRAPRRTASMEGRAIARPNSRLWWNRRFNGGPSNCLANPPAGRSSVLQWRAEQLLGQTSPGLGHGPPSGALLQWRAEQLLGQTCAFGGVFRLLLLASMEGRAIARPNMACRATTPPSFSLASMEGRAIARPNEGTAGDPWITAPGRTMSGAQRRKAELQWRAEQLLGQTSTASGGPVPGVLASMEGRAIARPNLYRALEDTGPTYSLQWRAEQLLGQTVRGVCEGRSPHFSFNGGPSNCSAKLGRLVEGVLGMGASMEGRAIARPNRETPPRARAFRSSASMEGRAIARPNMG